MYRMFDTADPMVPSSNTTEWVVSAGLDGKFADRFNWNLFYTHGSTHLLETTYGNWSFAKTAAALNAVTNPANGQVVCAVTLTNPTLYPGCTPINPFGAISAQSLAYAQSTTYITTDNIMDDVGGTVSGEIFSLPAGPVRTALTAEYRQMKLANATPFPSNVLTDCTGLTLNCSPTSSVYALNTTIPFSKSEGIGEVALESTLPLLKDMPLAKSLEINGAVRYANYSISGQATTWKIGGTWKPIDDLTIRVTRSQDVRAPSLYDLFQPLTVSAFGWGAVDVHTNTSAGVISLHKQGNAALVPEVSQTWTVGGVYRPHWAPRLSMSIDYYNMVMNNAITTVQGSQLYNQICEDSAGSSPFCSLIIRPNGFSDHTAANTLIGINGQPLNVALQSTYGADFELNYAQPLEDLNKSLAGNLQIRMLASYQPSFIVQANPTAVAFQQAGFANGSNPLWKFNLAGVYTLGNLNVNVQERWKSTLRMDYIPTDVWNQSGLPSIAYTDLTVAYNWKINGNSTSTFVTVQNLFDQKPRIYTGASGLLINYGSPVAQGDDVIGRYFTIGARMKF
jgi:outer membrane receptor protein involved in Fe transport